MSISTKIDPDQINIRDDAWELFEVTEDFITHRAPLERFPDGYVAYVHRKVPRGLAGMLEANKREFDDSHGKRFSDTSAIGTKIASTPLNVLFDPANQIAEKLKQGDKDHLKYWLNSEAARPFRTFRGKV